MSSTQTRELTFTFQNSATYLYGSNSYSYVPFTGTGGGSEYAFGVFGLRVTGEIYLNATAMDALFPNGSTHPTRFAGWVDCTTAVAGNTSYLRLFMDGTQYLNCQGLDKSTKRFNFQAPMQP